MSVVDMFKETAYYALTHGKSADKINLEQYIVASELLLDSIYSTALYEKQFDFLRFMNRHGCNTYQDVYDKLSGGIIDPVMIQYFVENHYLENADSMMSRVKKGYPELFINYKPEINLN